MKKSIVIIGLFATVLISGCKKDGNSSTNSDNRRGLPRPAYEANEKAKSTPILKPEVKFMERTYQVGISIILDNETGCEYLNLNGRGITARHGFKDEPPKCYESNKVQ